MSSSPLPRQALQRYLHSALKQSHMFQVNVTSYQQLLMAQSHAVSAPEPDPSQGEARASG